MTVDRPLSGNDPLVPEGLAKGAAPRPPWDEPGDGMVVVMRRLPGLTSTAVLKQPFVFQVPPLEELTVSSAQGWADSETVGAGTYSRAGAAGLRAVTIGSMFLSYDLWQWQREAPIDPPHPTDAVRWLNSIMLAKSPFQLLIYQVGAAFANGVPVRGMTELSMPATLRSLDRTVRAGEPETRYFTASFVEFRDPKITSRSLGGKKGTHASPRLPVTLPIATLAAKRDSLGELARFYYGSPHQWRVILNANAWMKGHIAPSASLKTLPKALLKKHPRVYIPRVQTTVHPTPLPADHDPSTFS